MLLTCHQYVYLLYLDECRRIVEVSSIIQREDFVHAVLLVLSLSFEPVSKELDFNLDSFKTEFTNGHHTLPGNSLSSIDNQPKSSRDGNQQETRSNPDPSMMPNDIDVPLNDSRDSGIAVDDENFSLDEFIEARKEREYIGHGRCGIVSRIHIKVIYKNNFCLFIYIDKAKLMVLLSFKASFVC